VRHPLNAPPMHPQCDPGNAGIDPERFTAAMEVEEVQMNIAKLLNR